MKTYLIGIAVISAILFCAIPAEPYLGVNLHYYYPQLVVFFIAQSLIIAFVLHKGLQDINNFPMYALGSIVLRLLTAVILLIVLFVIGVEDAAALSIQFMVIYLSFLLFELTVVLTNLRRN